MTFKDVSYLSPPSVVKLESYKGLELERCPPLGGIRLWESLLP